MNYRDINSTVIKFNLIGMVWCFLSDLRLSQAFERHSYTVNTVWKKWLSKHFPPIRFLFQHWEWMSECALEQNRTVFVHIHENYLEYHDPSENIDSLYMDIDVFIYITRASNKKRHLYHKCIRVRLAHYWCIASVWRNGWATDRCLPVCYGKAHFEGGGVNLVWYSETPPSQCSV